MKYAEAAMGRWFPDNPSSNDHEPLVLGQRDPSVSERCGALAGLLAVCSCALYCANGELLQWLQLSTPQDERHASPMLNLAFCHSGGLLFFPLYVGACCACARKSTATTSAYSGVLLPSLLFAVLLMGYNYAWLLSARLLPAAQTNAVFQTSVALVCVTTVVLFKETLTLGRLVGVLLALLGSAMAAGLFGQQAVGGPVLSPAGVMLALLAAIGYALYQVLFKYCFSCFKDDVRFLAYFSFLVSGWHLVFLPLIIGASWGGVEQLEIPYGWHAVLGTVASAMISSTVNAMYLGIVMWGTPMLLPCASAMSVPLTVFLDFMLHGVEPGRLELFGHLMVAWSVLLIIGVGQRQAVATPASASLGTKSEFHNL